MNVILVYEMAEVTATYRLLPTKDSLKHVFAAFAAHIRAEHGPVNISHLSANTALKVNDVLLGGGFVTAGKKVLFAPPGIRHPSKYLKNPDEIHCWAQAQASTLTFLTELQEAR